MKTSDLKFNVRCIHATLKGLDASCKFIRTRMVHLYTTPSPFNCVGLLLTDALGHALHAEDAKADLVILTHLNYIKDNVEQCLSVLYTCEDEHVSVLLTPSLESIRDTLSTIPKGTPTSSPESATV